MALITISKELVLTEAGSSVLRQAYFTCKRVILACAHYTLEAFNAYKDNAEIRRWPGKQIMVVVSADVSGKQSHEIGPLTKQSM